MKLSHIKGILRMDVGLYLVDARDTKCLCRCPSAVLDRSFSRSNREISFSDLFHQSNGVIGYLAKKDWGIKILDGEAVS